MMNSEVLKKLENFKRSVSVCFQNIIQSEFVYMINY
ncbi:uncharacterized protein METZ01_LOCUS113841 [marine metagenome]|uniref:Uncharacterized protein n=1 Tax=marine metagenome TaxID=408172 RepID=A0A381X9W9_9ZZZZ